MAAGSITNQIELDSLPPSASALDFWFDEQRIWSCDVRHLPAGMPATFAMPEALAPHLIGATTLTVRDSATGEVILEEEIAFTDHDQRVSIVDGDGNFLAVNKWGRLSTTLAGVEAVHTAILARTNELIDILHQQELRPFLVGGTLLGAVRDGKLLDHDDDADVAYLSRFTHPSDVAREHFALAAHLADLGYTIVQHSGAHMQLQFDQDPETPSFYIDIFAAFFTDDGHINQPFHVRGVMAESNMLPFGQIELGGYSFPRPANPDAWLTINYDKGWRTPIPGYRINTPPRTQRRFHNWFGSFNFKRDFWNDFYSVEGEKLAVAQASWDSSAVWVAGQSSKLTSPDLLEIGSGRGTLARDLSDGTRRVVASDYLAPIQADESDAPEFAHLNLMRLNSLAVPATLGFTGRFDIVINHVLELTGHLGRANALRLIHDACISGGTAVATVYGAPASGAGFNNPTTWHLSSADLIKEANEAGIHVRVEQLTPRDEYSAEREPYAAWFSLTPVNGAVDPLPAPKVSPARQAKRLIKATLRKVAGPAPVNPVAVLNAEISALEARLDRRRLELLHLAECIAVADAAAFDSSATSSSATPTKD